MALNRKPPQKPVASFSHVEYPGFVKLYLDDVQDVMDYITSLGGAPSLTAANAQATEAADLAECTDKELSRVSIRSVHPEVDVYLWSLNCTVRTVKDEPEAVAMVEGIAALLRERRTRLIGATRYMWRHGKLLLIVGGAIAIVPILIPLLDGGAISWPSALVVLGYFVVVVGLLLFSGWRTGGAIIVPDRRAEQRRMRSAARAAVVAGVSSGILGAAVGSVITYLLTRP